MKISQLKEGMRIIQVFYCKSKMSGTSTAGKEYYSLKLQDKSSCIDGKVWTIDSAIGEFETGDFIEVNAEVVDYKGTLQLKISRIRKAGDNEYDPRDFMPVSQFSTEEMFDKLMTLKSYIENPYLQKLTDKFFIEDEDFIREFKKHSAAKNIHHNFIGGLLQHTLRVTELCYFYANQYPMLNRDLLLTAAMFHDIGKVRELSAFPLNDYTDEGQLIGHIVIGFQMVRDKIREIEGFPEKLETELLHCILAHQGKLEFGSPKVPALLEAMALSYADDTDAKMEIMIEEFGKTKSKEFLGFNKLLNTNIRKTSVTEIPEAALSNGEDNPFSEIEKAFLKSAESKD